MASPYEQERQEIQSAFNEGMDELFKTMFTETVLLYPLDEENTKTNVYEETEKKVYLHPYPLTAKVVMAREQGEQEVQTIQQTSTVTFPVLQFEKLGIPHKSDEDLDFLQKCAIVYRGIHFLVDKVLPKTHVADTFLFLEFQCTTRDKDTTEYVFPDQVVEPPTAEEEAPSDDIPVEPDEPMEGEDNGNDAT